MCTVDGWLHDLWLVVISDAVPDEDVRRWWNCKDTEVLDDLVEAAPKFRLGTIVVTAEDAEPPSPTRRVSDLLFFRGTYPEYVLPLLDDDLQADLIKAFAAQPGDHPVMEAAPLANFAAFLGRHKGKRVATTCQSGTVHVSLRPGGIIQR